MQIESGKGRWKEIRSEEEGGERLAIFREGRREEGKRERGRRKQKKE